MSFDVLHVVPSRSAAGTVRRALESLGSSEKVVPIGDHLGYGPIGVDAGTRRAWLQENLGAGYGEEADRAAIAWNDALAPDRFPIIWNCRSDAGDFAGFLEFVSRIGNRSFGIIDATGLAVEDIGIGAEALALGLLSEKNIVAHDLPNRRSTLSSKEINEARAEWLRLKKENALLRVMQDGALTSESPSFFDPTLLMQVSTEWERGVRIVGNAMTKLFMAGHHVNDDFIWWRYCALESESAIEFDELPEKSEGMRGYRLRLVLRK
jgi:hypothetical protein